MQQFTPEKTLKLVHISVVSALVFCLLAISAAGSVILPFGENVHERLEEVPAHEIALVFGGGMNAPGEQSDMQRSRVDAAVALYKAGKVQKLVMTGDDGGSKIDEVTYMERYAIEQGVAVNDVATDPHGYRTYESCYRGAHVYEFEKVLAISQDFHLPRIRYFCETFGIETVGFAADEFTPQLNKKNTVIRELFARVKGVWQIRVSKPTARIVDEPYDIFKTKTP